MIKSPGVYGIEKQKKKMHAIFIDFEKAFDKINHTLYLIKKLFELKMPTDLLNFVNNLNNRKVSTYFKDFKSETFDSWRSASEIVPVSHTLWTICLRYTKAKKR